MTQPQQTSLKDQNILVVDDNPLQAEYIKDLLHDVQANAVTVNTAEEALKILEDTPASFFSCILLDTLMPGTDGFQLAQMMRAMPSHELSIIPIIGLLTSDNVNEHDKAFASGMNSVIIKPITPPKLYDELQMAQRQTFLGLHGTQDDLKGKSAYVITEDASLADELNISLKKLGITLTHFSSFNDLMAVVEKSQVFDFAFFDWKGDSIDDMSLAQKIEMFAQNTFNHLISITKDWSQIERYAATLNIDAYVKKPVSPLEIQNVLGKIQLDERFDTESNNEDFSDFKVLIADDNATNAIVLQNAIETFGAEADIAEDGNEALQMLTSAPTNTYSLAFLDIFMPGLRGFEVAEKFRQLDRVDAITLPIIGISGNSSIDLVEQAISAGMNALMLKPINKKSLLAYMNIFLKEENVNDIITARLSTRLQNMQADLVHSKYKVDIISYLVNHLNTNDILNYIATHLLESVDCDSVLITRSDDTILRRNKPNVVMDEKINCWKCPFQARDSSVFANAVNGMLYFDDTKHASESGLAIPCKSKSLLIRTIMFKGKEWGRIAIHFFNQTHTFTDSDKSLVHIASDVITMALERDLSIQTMKQQERESQLIVDNAMLPLAMFDYEGKLLRANQQFQFLRSQCAERKIETKLMMPVKDIINYLSPEQETKLQINEKDWVVHAQAVLDESQQLQYVFEFCTDITEISRNLKQQQAINQCFEIMLRQDTDFDKAIRAILNEIVAFFKADGGYILHFNLASHSLQDIFCSDSAIMDDLKKDILELPNMELKDWFNTLNVESMVFLNDLNKSPIYQVNWNQLLGKYDIQSLGIVKLSCNNTLWGNIGLIFKDPKHEFSDADKQMLAAFQNTLGMILVRNELMEHLKEERDKAIEAEKSKSLFFATVSHDIRTPLNAIVGFADLLNTGSVDPQTQKKYLDIILNSSNVLKSLISDILDLSKLEAGNINFVYEPTYFKDFADEIVVSFKPQTQEKGVELITDFGDISVVDIDRKRVRQVLFNLLSNAVKFTAHGSITIKADFKKIADDGDLSISVTDTGIGIEEKNIRTIMQPFAQVKGMYEGGGAGLGLAICTLMLSKMNGELKIDSVFGKGSTFTMVLHHVKSSNATEDMKPKAVAAAMPKDLASWKVLIVDDSPVNLAVLKALLKQTGISNVTAAKSGQEALQHIDGNSFNLVLTDMWMPNMNGAELVANIRKIPQLVKLPVYVVTADVDAMKTFKDFDFTGILLKPLNLENLKALFASL